MPFRIPRPRFRLWWLIVLVALAAIAVWGLMPPRPGIVDLKEGTGRAVASGDKVEVHYVGRLGVTRFSYLLGRGKEIDSSRARNAPLVVPVGQGMVIRGWELGLIGMKPGGIRRLVIAPADAYGELGHPPTVPPNATLIFEVELLRILP